MTINVTGETITENIHNRMLKKLFKLRLNHGDDRENWPNQITTTLDRLPNYYVAVEFRLIRSPWEVDAYQAAAYVTYMSRAGGRPTGRAISRNDFNAAWDGAVYPHSPVSNELPFGEVDLVKPFIGVGNKSRWMKKGGMIEVVPDLGCGDEDVERNVAANDPNFTKKVLATSDHLVGRALEVYGLPDVYIKRGQPLVLHDELMRCDIRLIERHANELMNNLQDSIGVHTSDEANLYARRILEYSNRGIDRVIRWWNEQKKEADHVSVHSPVGESEHDTNGQEKEYQHATAG